MFLMLKTVESIARENKESFVVPARIQDTLPVKRIWEDGIFLVGRRQYSKTWKFSDINYRVSSEESKEKIFLMLSEIYNSFDSTAQYKITIQNHMISERDFESQVLMKMRNDSNDEYREEYNQMLMDKARGANGIIQERYLTVTKTTDDHKSAKSYFDQFESLLDMRFHALGSRLVPLDASEKLRIFHDFYRQGEESYYQFDLKRTMQRMHDFKDYISPDSFSRVSNLLNKGGDYMIINDKYVRALYLSDYGSSISDDIVAELTSPRRTLMLSIDILDIPSDEALLSVKNHLMGQEKNIHDWEQKQNEKNSYMNSVPYDFKEGVDACVSFLDGLSKRNQHAFMCILTMLISADSKEQLDLDTQALKSTAKAKNCDMAVLNIQQLSGLQTCLPFGKFFLEKEQYRLLNTESLATFMPFKTQEIIDPNGIYYGENAISHNLIMCNRDALQNQSGFILGVPGSGKSMAAKQLITFLMLNTDDDILICDPEGEYSPLVEAFGSDIGTVIKIKAGGKDKLNAMYMVQDYDDTDPVSVKSQFIMSLIEQMDARAIGPQQRSIIDRCIRIVFAEAQETGIEPTLCLLREKLLEQPEKEARQLALTLELYTSGSLDIFGKGTNVDLDKRVVVFDIHDLGEQLKPTGLLVITDTMMNRISRNGKNTKKTHIFIDEVHIIFDNEYSSKFFNSAWRQFRKRNSSPTAITQNIESLLKSEDSSTMLSNSEFVMMLNQAPNDRALVQKLMHISDEQMRYITNVDAGCGLIRHGGEMVPFINRFPTDTKLYSLMTTKPGESQFMLST